MTMPLDENAPYTITITTPPSAVQQMTVQIPGLQGPPGEFRLGTVTTGAPGTDASATTTTGSDGVEVVNFTIPRGDVGPFGSLTMGAVTTLAPGSNASAAISGPAGSQTLTLSIPQGATGAAGPTGATGPQGIQGIQGPQGATGATGPAGKDGTSIQVAGEVATYADLPTNLTSADSGKGWIVDADGLIYVWSGTSFPANGSGAQFVGPAGPANTLTIGSVTTGAAGAAAAATITGTSPNQTLNLTIPTGATGAQGAPGPANTLSIGTVTTGAAGTNAAASITGASPAQSLNLTIPQGAQGTAGTNGTNGQGVLFLGASDPVPANTPANTVIFRPNTKMATFYWGSGTSYPSTGVSYGDTYFHTGLGGLMRYNGTSWTHPGAVSVANATARTNISTSYSGALYAGFQVRQNDTAATYEWNGSAWCLMFMDALIPSAEWTVVGTSGAPAFLNSWGNYDNAGTYSKARYTKIGGIVYVRGLVAGGTIGNPVFTLPTGYRPAYEMLLASNANAAIARLDILQNGGVQATSGSNSWFSIDCQFPAEM